MSDARDSRLHSRRDLLRQAVAGLGLAAVGGMPSLRATEPGAGPRAAAPDWRLPATAKQVIYLHMVGGPSQMDLFDPKPRMQALANTDLPPSIRNGQRLTTMSSGQSHFPIAPSIFSFAQHGQCGMALSELMPHLATKVDDICWMRSLWTDPINHEPAMTMIQTGNMNPGRPCIGSWVSYALGTINPNLPPFVVLVAIPTNREQEQAISGRLWSAGFLPAEHQGVSFRSSGDPILYIGDPPGIDRSIRRVTLDGIGKLDALAFERWHDAETRVRMANYEMSYRMQASVPELVDLSKESPSTIAMYGSEARRSGTYANAALMARRLVERGVRFVQVYHNNWDHHSNLPVRMRSQCLDVDRANTALLTDLKSRGLLDSTLVIWGGEFGRTIYCQGKLTKEVYGRDHHPRCFSMWMAGGGAKPGMIYGETDDFAYNIVKNPMHVRDLHATILRLLGIDHERLVVRYQGLDAKLTGVVPARVITDLIA